MYFDYHDQMKRHADAPLAPGPKIFTDWRYIQCGSINWLKGAGDRTGSNALYAATPDDVADPPNLRFVPRGIRIQTCKAIKEGPLDCHDQPWESGFNYTTLMHDQGVYRMWYNSNRPGAIGANATEHPDKHLLVSYAESDDAVNWRKPNLGIVELDGYDTNVLLSSDDCNAAHLGGWSVFKDPSAPDDQRYKMIFLGSANTDVLIAHPERVGGHPDVAKVFIDEAKKCPGDEWNGLRIAVSPDGLKWTILDDILFMHFSDTQNVAYYDTTLKKYVGFFRMNYAGRRHIGRSETDDFRSWPMPTPVLASLNEQSPHVDYYLNARCNYPGSEDVHLMFPMLYDRATDFSDIHLASSYDSAHWSLVPGGPVVERGDIDDWDGGFNAVLQGLIRRPDGTLAVRYEGSPMPHKYARYQTWGGCGFATWPHGRLSALRADDFGECWTLQLQPTGRTLALNCAVLKAGHLKIAVCDPDGTPLPGRSLDDCDPLSGDHPRVTVTWRGQSDLSHADGRKIVLHLQLAHTSIYSFEFI